MKLFDLAEDLATGGYGKMADVFGLTSDSREVRPGYLFAALAGSKDDGTAYVKDAVARGASAVLASTGADVSAHVPVVRSGDVRRTLAQMAARFYGRQPDCVVGITGTSGKTSIAVFMRQIWIANGLKAASIGTTGIVSPTRNEYSSLTTLEPVVLARLMTELAEDGVSHASIEASSHGLDQRRLDGVSLSAAGFINLGRDHMDYHPTVEDYFRAKMRLFDTLLPKSAPAVIFADDRWSMPAIEVAQRAGATVMTVGVNGSFLKLKRLEHERYQQIAEIEAAGRLHRIVLPLAGKFQMANALVAAGLAIATGLNVDDALPTLEHLKGAPGRLELAGIAAGGAPVFVDYAHKPEALENVLLAVRPFTTGRVIVVFGCGGDRDRGKRPIMGEIAQRLADVVFVTDDNPRSEVPREIRAEILAAVPDAQEIGNRREAIQEAIGLARPGDTIIVAGKGHENGQQTGSIILPFSDHKEVCRAIAEASR